MILGAITVVATFSPPLRGRLELLLEILPFAVLHTADTTMVFAGFALIITARGLSRGNRLAWTASVGLLLVAVMLNLVRGLDVEEGILSAALVVWLLVRQRVFTVMPTRMQLVRAAGVAVIGGGAAVSVAVVLVMTAGRRRRPRWGETVGAAAERLGGDSRLPLTGMGPGTAPILLAAGIGVVAVTLWLLTSPQPSIRRSDEWHHRDRERARRIVTTHGGGTLDYFALRDDRQWFFTGRSMAASAAFP